MKQLLFLLLLLFTSKYILSQNKRISKKTEFIVGLGTSTFRGDLDPNPNNSQMVKNTRDIARQTRHMMTLGLRKSINDHLSLGAFLTHAKVTGNDKYSKDIYRENRNLHFKSNILEFSALIEAGLYRVQSGQRYLKKIKGVRNKNVYFYAFTGVGVFKFNPKANYNGHWFKLQPLGTEGQGLEGNKKYKRIALAIPLGLGCRIKFRSNKYLGLQLSYRFTSTDYIDDVSGVYYDNKKIAGRNEITAYLADPSLNKLDNNVTAKGSQRGNPRKKDGYLFVTVHLSMFNLTSKKSKYSS